MATSNELIDAIGAVLRLLPGEREIVYESESEAAQPSRPYLTYRQGATTGGDTVTRSFNSSGLETIRTQRLVEFRIEAVGGDSVQDLGSVQLLFQSSARSFDLWRICGLNDVGVITDLTALEVGTMRSRHAFSLQVWTTSELTVPVDFIESACFELVEDDKAYRAMICGLPPGVCIDPQTVNSVEP